ncbi:nitrogenase iron-molybdenum cofactor biosynthesis protein NifN [Methylobacter sp.]|uniref:nitrogenase iron-molybdenum cofactor biosynthesis protein NifN n=1 Tax=Methylobacter sp. TaxID=2051955 RepID=UPI002FDDCFFC
MANIIFPNKALTVNPLKVSQSMGASLAFFGINRCLPLEHGAQGCTAFSRVFFTRHFREPIPLQTTAIDHAVTVMGADANIVEALKTISERNQPDLIGLVTTGLSETQGADILGSIREFRAAYPDYAQVAVAPVNTPDTLGCLETGFAAAVEAIIATLVPESRVSARKPQQVNVLLSSMLTPGDVETVAEWVSAFGLQPLLLPDLGDSLDGHIEQLGFSTLTTGGIDRNRIAMMGESVATLVVGSSLNKAADLLKVRTGVPDYRFAGLMGLDACDDFTATLSAISGKQVPRKIVRQRAQLLDAMVDCHLQFGGVQAAVAADPELLGMLVRFFKDLGVDVPTAVSSVRSETLTDLPVDRVVVGDLEDLEQGVRESGADFLVTNSHGAELARQLGIPLLRAGFPLYDRYGGFARRWIGYAGSRQILFDTANLITWQRREITSYRSIYRQDAVPDVNHSQAACMH